MATGVAIRLRLVSRTIKREVFQYGEQFRTIEESDWDAGELLDLAEKIGSDFENAAPKLQMDMSRRLRDALFGEPGSVLHTLIDKAEDEIVFELAFGSDSYSDLANLPWECASRPDFSQVVPIFKKLDDRPRIRLVRTSSAAETVSSETRREVPFAVANVEPDFEFTKDHLKSLNRLVGESVGAQFHSEPGADTETFLTEIARNADIVALFAHGRPPGAEEPAVKVNGDWKTFGELKKMIGVPRVLLLFPCNAADTSAEWLSIADQFVSAGSEAVIATAGVNFEDRAVDVLAEFVRKRDLAAAVSSARIVMAIAVDQPWAAGMLRHYGKPKAEVPWEAEVHNDEAGAVEGNRPRTRRRALLSVVATLVLAALAGGFLLFRGGDVAALTEAEASELIAGANADLDSGDVIEAVAASEELRRYRVPQSVQAALHDLDALIASTLEDYPLQWIEQYLEGSRFLEAIERNDQLNRGSDEDDATGEGDSADLGEVLEDQDSHRYHSEVLGALAREELLAAIELEPTADRYVELVLQYVGAGDWAAAAQAADLLEAIDPTRERESAYWRLWIDRRGGLMTRTTFVEQAEPYQLSESVSFQVAWTYLAEVSWSRRSSDRSRLAAAIGRAESYVQEGTGGLARTRLIASWLRRSPTRDSPIDDYMRAGLDRFDNDWLLALDFATYVEAHDPSLATEVLENALASADESTPTAYLLRRLLPLYRARGEVMAAAELGVSNLEAFTSESWVITWLSESYDGFYWAEGECDRHAPKPGSASTCEDAVFELARIASLAPDFRSDDLTFFADDLTDEAAIELYHQHLSVPGVEALLRLAEAQLAQGEGRNADAVQAYREAAVLTGEASSWIDALELADEDVFMEWELLEAWRRETAVAPPSSGASHSADSVALEQAYWTELATRLLRHAETGVCPAPFPGSCESYLLERLDSRGDLLVLDPALARTLESSAPLVRLAAEDLAINLVGRSSWLTSCATVAALITESPGRLRELLDREVVTRDKVSRGCAAQIAQAVTAEDLGEAWNLAGGELDPILAIAAKGIGTGSCPVINVCLDDAMNALQRSDLTATNTAEVIAHFAIPLVVEHGRPEDVTVVLEATRVLLNTDAPDVALCEAVGRMPLETRDTVLDILTPWRNAKGRSDCLLAFASEAVSSGLLEADQAWREVVSTGLSELAEIEFLNGLIKDDAASCEVTATSCVDIAERVVDRAEEVTWTSLRRLDELAQTVGATGFRSHVVARALERYISGDPERSTSFYYCSLFERYRQSFSPESLALLESQFPSNEHRIQCFAPWAAQMAAMDLDDAWEYLNIGSSAEPTSEEQEAAILRARSALITEALRTGRCPDECVEDAVATMRLGGELDIGVETWSLAAALVSSTTLETFVGDLASMDFVGEAPCLAVDALTSKHSETSLPASLGQTLRNWSAPEVRCWRDVIHLAYTPTEAWNAANSDNQAWRRHMPFIVSLGIAESDGSFCALSMDCEAELVRAVRRLTIDPTGAGSSLHRPEVELTSRLLTSRELREIVEAGLLSCDGLSGLDDASIAGFFVVEATRVVFDPSACVSFLVNRLVPIDASAAWLYLELGNSDPYWRIVGLLEALRADSCSDLFDDCWAEIDRWVQQSPEGFEQYSYPLIQDLIRDDRSETAVDLVESAMDSGEYIPRNVCAGYDDLYEIEPAWVLGIATAWDGDFDHFTCFQELADALVAELDGLSVEETEAAVLRLIGGRPETRLEANLLARIAFRLDPDRARPLLELAAAGHG